MARRKPSSAGRSDPVNGSRIRHSYYPATPAGRRSLPYDPLSDAERVFSLFGQAEIPPRPRSRTVRPLIRTVLGDSKKLSPGRPFGLRSEGRFVQLMNRALPIGRPSLCARRSTRRGVLFARKLTGAGSRSKRSRGPDSLIRCRR